LFGKNIRENIKISATGYYELKQVKPWFNEGDQTIIKKISNLQLLQYPSQITENNLNSVRPIIIRYFRKRKNEYLKEKINGLATYSRNKILKTYIEE
jgi:hypothetical protein